MKRHPMETTHVDDPENEGRLYALACADVALRAGMVEQAAAIVEQIKRLDAATTAARGGA